MTTRKQSPAKPARTTVRLPDDIHRRAKLAAAWSGRKIQDFIAEAVEEHLKNAEQEMRMSDEASGAKSIRPPKPKV